MNDYISRKAVIEALDGICETCGKYKKADGVLCASCRLDGATDMIEGLPSADVQPVRRGAWERMGQKKNFLGCKMIRCSECFERYAVQNIDEERYCRACGARMNAGNNSITFHINDIEAEVAKIVQQAEAEKESGERDEC